MNNLMPSSPSSQASSSKAVTDTFMPPDEIINETLISLFYLTSEGGFMSKDTRIVNHRELNKKVQIELVINGCSFWMDAKEISQSRLCIPNAFSFIFRGELDVLLTALVFHPQLIVRGRA